MRRALLLIVMLLMARTFKPGALVVAAGEPAAAMYLIGSGEATVCVVPGRPIKLLEGDSFGEMALLAPAQTRRDRRHTCRVYILDSEGLTHLSGGHPEIVRHIRNVAKERERESAARANRTDRDRWLI